MKQSLAEILVLSVLAWGPVVLIFAYPGEALTFLLLGVPLLWIMLPDNGNRP